MEMYSTPGACTAAHAARMRARRRAMPAMQSYFIFLFFFVNNFVAYFTTQSVLQEGGNRLSPPGFPLGPVCVN